MLIPLKNEKEGEGTRKSTKDNTDKATKKRYLKEVALLYYNKQ